LSILKLSNNRNLTGAIDVSRGVYLESKNTKLNKIGGTDNSQKYICHAQDNDQVRIVDQEDIIVPSKTE